MTTVLIDFKTKKIVADKQTTYHCLSNSGDIIEETLHRGVSDKIVQISEEVYAVGAGNKREIERQIDYLKAFGYVDTVVKVKCVLAVVRVKGEGLLVDLYEHKKTRWTWLTKKFKFDVETIQGGNKVLTFGSGSDYAFGAFESGCSPEDSVRAASKCDKYTSYEIDVVQL